MLQYINVENNTHKNLTIQQKSRLLTGGTHWTSAGFIEENIPPIRFSDGPTGLRLQGCKGDHLGKNKSFKATCFPTLSALACSWNKNIAYTVGAMIGEEANAFGVDVLLAPGLNIKRNALCGRNFEYFSEDPYFNGKMGASYVNGVQSKNVGACIKHFAANNREFGRLVCDSVVDERTLREVYLTAFEIAVKEAKPAAVMTAYNMLNGVYCNENKTLITDILRGEWGFDGIVISDWGGTNDRAAAVKAGADIEMPPCRFTSAELIDAVYSGKLSESEIDACAERLIKYSRREKTRTDCAYEEHAEFAASCAAECAVLLKNDGVLPLSGGKVALVGDVAVNALIQGGGSSKVNPQDTDTLYNCLKGSIIGYARGYERSGESKRLQRRALKLCQNADTVIFCAGLYDGDDEGADRKNIKLPENQINLLNKILKLKKRVAVVLFCGCAVDTSWDSGVGALLLAGLGGQYAARAVAKILKGEINPSGKLAETFPVAYENTRSAELFCPSAYYTLYSEGMDFGYRNADNVKYPFGFGLSYTKFEYSNFQVDSSGISFEITNVGETSGGEAAQTYLRFPENANAPDLQLKGFEKVFLAAGESKRVHIPFDEYTFRSYDALNKRWARVTGRYEIFIGASAADVRLQGFIDIEGDCDSVEKAQVESLAPSQYPLQFDAKGRLIVDIHTPFYELKRAKGWFGRAFSAISLHTVRKKRTVYGSMEYLPMRTLAQFGNMKKSTIDGLIHMFNGSFFKGLFKIIKGK